MNTVSAQSLQCDCLFATLWTVAHQAPLSVGFSWQEYWSGSSFPPPGNLHNTGIEPVSPALASRFFTTSKEAHRSSCGCTEFHRDVLALCHAELTL